MLKPLLFTSLLFLTLISAVIPGDWHLHSQEDGIRVYTRKTGESKIKEIRIKLELKVSIDQFFEVLGDPDNYDQWVFKSRNTRLVESVDENEFYYASEIDMPFPAKDRDIIVHSKNWKEDGIYYSKSKAVANYMPEIPSMIRIKSYESNWKIEPLTNGRLSVDYQSKIDPGGLIPKWMVNLGIAKGPMESMKALKLILSK